jgi:hypothetical protein
MKASLALCALAFLLSACGSAAPRDSAEDFSGADRAVAATVERMETAAREDDPERLCTQLLSEKLLAAIEEGGTNCVTAAREGFKDASSKDLTVDDVEIRGDTATAKITSGSGSSEKSDTLQLEKVGAGWKIASLQSS